MGTAVIEVSKSTETVRSLQDYNRLVRDIRSRVADEILVAASIIGSLALFASLSRVSTIGWRPVLLVHVAVFVLLVIATFVRSRLSLEVRVWLLIALGTALGIGGMLTFGIIGSSSFFFVLVSVVAGLLLGWQYGTIILAGGLVFVSIEGIAIHNNLISFHLDIIEYLREPSTWVVMVVTTGLLTGILLTAQHHVYKALTEALRKMSDLTSQLQTANANLKTEIYERLESERREADLHTRLDQAMTRALSGFVTICANCKRIREGEENWVSVEDYVSHRTEAQFSHEICKCCAKELYPDLVY